MDSFSYFITFYGLILGLALTELLGGFAHMVRARALKKLERQGEQAQARLDRAKALLERQTGDTADDADAEADPLRRTKDQKVKHAKVDKANRGHHGSAGNHGKSGR